MKKTTSLSVVLDFIPGGPITVRPKRVRDVLDVIKSVDTIEERENTREISKHERMFVKQENSWMSTRMKLLGDEMMDFPDSTSHYSAISQLIPTTSPQDLTAHVDDDTRSGKYNPVYRPRATIARDIIMSAFNTLHYVRRKKNVQKFSIFPIMELWVMPKEKHREPVFPTWFIDNFGKLKTWKVTPRSYENEKLIVFTLVGGLIRLKRRHRRRTILSLQKQLKHKEKTWVFKTQDFTYEGFLSRVHSHSSMDKALENISGSKILIDITDKSVILGDGPLSAILKKIGGSEISNYKSTSEFLRHVQKMYDLICTKHTPGDLTHATALSILVRHERYSIALSLLKSRSKMSDEMISSVALVAARQQAPTSFIVDLMSFRDQVLSKTPSAACWLARIISFGYCGFSKAVLEYRKWLKIKDEKITSYDSEMFNVLFKIGTPASGYGVWSEMKRRKFPISDSHVNSWLQCCSSHRDVDTAITVASLATVENLKPSWEEVISIALLEDPQVVFPNLFLLQNISSTVSITKNILSSILTSVTTQQPDYVDQPHPEVPILYSSHGLLSPAVKET